MPAASSTLTGTCPFQSKTHNYFARLSFPPSLRLSNPPPPRPPPPTSSVCVQWQQRPQLCGSGRLSPPPRKNRKLLKRARDEARTECKLLQLSEESSVSTHPQPSLALTVVVNVSCKADRLLLSWRRVSKKPDRKAKSDT